MINIFSRELEKWDKRIEIKKKYQEAMHTYEIGTGDNHEIEDKEIVNEAFKLVADVTKMSMEYKQKYG